MSGDWIENTDNWLDGIGGQGRNGAQNHKRKYRARSIKVVWYTKIRCPYCGSDDTRVYGTSIPIRYHKCNACRRKFISKEKN